MKKILFLSASLMIQDLSADIYMARFLYGIGYGTMYATAGISKIALTLGERCSAWMACHRILSFPQRYPYQVPTSRFYKDMGISFGIWLPLVMADKFYGEKVWPSLRDTYIPRYANNIYDLGMKFPVI